jgi:hypothetical protein
VFTKDILFGMNILTLAGFAVMGITLTLNRMGQAGKALSIGLMTAGTALVFAGLYAGGGLKKKSSAVAWRPTLVVLAYPRMHVKA